MTFFHRLLDWCLIIVLALVAAYVVNPAFFSFVNVDWLLDGDRAQSLIGWEFFKNSEFSYPVTRIANLFPSGMLTVIQTDSIPWLAIVSKFIDSFVKIKGSFHYFGFWLVLNWVLQGIMAGLIADELNFQRFSKFLLVFFFLFAPPFIFRTSHLALMAHWILLYIMYEAIRLARGQSLGFLRFLLVTLLVVLSAGIHPYWFALTAPILLTLIFIDKNGLLSKLGRSLVLFGALVFEIKWLGFASVKEPVSADFGACNSDVLGWLNSFGTSLFFPALRSFWCQNEGYAYLGLSILSLLIYFRRSAINQIKSLWNSNLNKIYFGLLIAYLIYSAASPIRFGGNPIIYLPFYHWIEPLPSIFRSTGRWIWPIYYSILILAIFLLDRATIKKKAIVFGGVVFIHFIEFFPFYNFYFTQSNVVNSAVNRINSKLPEPSNQSKKIFLWPNAVSVTCGFDKDQWRSKDWAMIMVALARKGWQVDSGLGARFDKNSVEHCLRANKGELPKERPLIFYEPNNTLRNLPQLANRVYLLNESVEK